MGLGQKETIHDSQLLVATSRPNGGSHATPVLESGWMNRSVSERVGVAAKPATYIFPPNVLSARVELMRQLSWKGRRRGLRTGPYSVGSTSSTRRSNG